MTRPSGRTLVLLTVALALNDCGVGVKEIKLRTPTLDDVFLHVTGGRFQEDSVAEEASV